MSALDQLTPSPDAYPDDAAIHTDGLTKRFGERTAIDSVDLHVPHGSAFGFLGPNGAGKTTMIRMLLGLTRASAGSMSVLGHPVPSERAQALARVGAIVEEPRFHPQLTGRENLRIVAAVRGRRRTSASRRPCAGLGSQSARTRRSRSTRSVCASVWASPAACWPIRFC